jgi:hypothetical protein
MNNLYEKHPEDFKRRIIAKIYTNRKDLLDEEQRWLNMIKPTEFKKKYYNIIPKTFYAWHTIENNRKKTIQERLSQSAYEAHARPEVRVRIIEAGIKRRGRKQTEAEILKRSEAMKRAMAEKFPVENRKVRLKFGSEEYCANMAEKSAERWKDPEYKKRVGAAISIANTNREYKRGYKQTPETIEKRTAKLKGKQFTESHCTALGISQKNKVWWTNGITRTRALECPGEGWVRGRKINKTVTMLET